MNSEPERIWAEHTRYFQRDDVYIKGGRWNDDEESGLTGYVRADIHDRLCAEWAEASQNNYQIAKAAVAERDALAAALTTIGAKIIAAVAAPQGFTEYGNYGENNPPLAPMGEDWGSIIAAMAKP